MAPATRPHGPGAPHALTVKSNAVAPAAHPTPEFETAAQLVPAVVNSTGLLGVVLRIAYPRYAFPAGGAQASLLQPLPLGEVRREDRIAAVLSPLLAPIIVGIQGLLPLGRVPDNPRDATAADFWPFAFTFALSLSLLMQPMSVIWADIILGKAHPLASGGRPLWDTLAIRVLNVVPTFVMLCGIVQLLGYFPFASLFIIALWQAGDVTMVLWLSRRRPPLKHHLKLLASAGESSSFVMAIQAFTAWTSAQTTNVAAQSAVMLVSEVLTWLVKLRTRRQGLAGPYVGPVVTELLVDGMATMLMLTSLPRLEAGTIALTLVGQVAGCVSQTMYALRRAGANPQRRDIVLGRFALACLMNAVVPLALTVLAVSVRNGPNAENMSFGHWPTAGYRDALVVLAMWGVLFVGLFVVARARLLRAGDPDLLSLLFERLIKHAAVVGNAMGGAAGVTFLWAHAASQLGWFVFPEDGYSA